MKKIVLAGLGAAVAIGFVGTLASATHQPLLLGSLGASNTVPGTTGLPSVLALQRDGYQVLTF